jgi:hypothetical protein
MSLSVLLMFVAISAGVAGQNDKVSNARIVFVCEHGAAKSVFAISCSLPSHATASGKAENWTDVPEVSDGYAESRDAIKRHVEQLLDQLATNREHYQ